MANLKTIAKEAGVSVATVSVILNAPEKAERFREETIAEVRAIAQRVGYRRNASRRGMTLPARSPSLAAVARQAQVSIATASIILNSPDKAGSFTEERIRQVREVAAKMGYQRNIHASRFRTRQAQAIGLVIEYLKSQHLVDLPFWAWQLSGLDYAARLRGYEVVIVGPLNDQTAMAHAVMQYHQHRLDGIVVPGELLPMSAGLLREFPGASVMTARPSSRQGHAIFEDDSAGLRMVVEHLHELGHRRITWLGPEQWPGRAASHRRRVVQRETRRWGMRCEEVVIPREPRTKSVEELVAAARLAATRLFRRSRRCTAVACFNDECALGVYQAAYEQGVRIPEDVSVTGYDDHHGMYFHPGLTTVRSSIVDVGQAAAEWLIDAIEAPDGVNSDQPIRQKIAPSLSVRASTARPL